MLNNADLHETMRSKQLLLRTHHQKRERAGYYDEQYFYKVWVPNWEHAKVSRHVFEVGYYNLEIVPAFRCFLTHEGLDRGYIMHLGQVIGGSADNWDRLVNNTTKEQRIKFIKTIFERAVVHESIVSDMAPSNVILYDGKISLIDLEAHASFDWLFKQQPKSWEAQSRNMNKVPSPLWRDMSKYLLSYLDQCVGIKYDKKLDCVDNLAEVNDILRGL